MSALLLILVIVVLVVVHEFGHLIAAKITGMRVDEFGLGYPPRAATLGKIGETEYTLNWIPFGGFVKIYGENDTALKASRAFASKSRPAQAFVLVAGVAMNVILAYVLISAALIIGTPRALNENELAIAEDVRLAVAGVLPNSPAETAGIQPGDVILNAVHAYGAWNPATNTDHSVVTPEAFTSFIATGSGNTLRLLVDRGGADISVTATPLQGVVENDPERYVLGVEVAPIGVVSVGFAQAISEGFVLTREMIILTAEGLWQFLSSVFTFSANFTQVAGPVGIAGVVGSASTEGFGSLLSIVAIISINLALINLIPVPALDGGRLLFVIIESVIRRPIKPSVAQAVNGIGFAFLLLLMLVVTAHDIFKIVG